MQIVEGRTEAPRRTARRRGLAGVRERGMRTLGFARNLGGPDVSGYESDRAPRQRVQARGAVALHVHGSEEASAAGTAERRQRSEAGGAAGRRSSP